MFTRVTIAAVVVKAKMTTVKLVIGPLASLRHRPRDLPPSTPCRRPNRCFRPIATPLTTPSGPSALSRTVVTSTSTSRVPDWSRQTLLSPAQILNVTERRQCNKTDLPLCGLPAVTALSSSGKHNFQSQKHMK